jgi:hypothetical protein
MSTEIDPREAHLIPGLSGKDFISEDQSSSSIFFFFCC